MVLTSPSLSSIPTSYATVSIGTPQTPLPQKLDAIASAGWQGIELGFPDLLSYTSQRKGRDIDAKDYDTLCDVAEEVKKLCQDRDLEVVMLQPFANFEGWQQGSAERGDAFTRAKGWIRIMDVVGCDILQVGSSDSPDMNTSLEAIVSDLRELSDLLAPHNFRLAYENWCWSTHAPDWKDVWNIVSKVDRANVGLCLDTFQTAGGEWADPTTESGLIENVGSREELEKRFQGSLRDLSATVPADKIYILQISDAYKTRLPSTPNSSGLRPRGQWSSCLRPIPFAGGYLPVVDVVRAVLRTGFKGWFSTEVFDGGPKGDDQTWKDLGGYARDAMLAHERLLKEVQDKGL